MNVFIWTGLDNMSQNYHANGGLVVIAQTVHEARERLRATPSIPKDCDAFTKPPTIGYELAADTDAAVYEFPDAGCC
jgi:hypothetical protein